MSWRMSHLGNFVLQLPSIGDQVARHVTSSVTLILNFVSKPKRDSSLSVIWSLSKNNLNFLLKFFFRISPTRLLRTSMNHCRLHGVPSQGTKLRQMTRGFWTMFGLVQYRSVVHVTNSRVVLQEWYLGLMSHLKTIYLLSARPSLLDILIARAIPASCNWSHSLSRWPLIAMIRFVAPWDFPVGSTNCDHLYCIYPILPSIRRKHVIVT